MNRPEGGLGEDELIRQIHGNPLKRWENQIKHTLVVQRDERQQGGTSVWVDFANPWGLVLRSFGTRVTS